MSHHMLLHEANRHHSQIYSRLIPYWSCGQAHKKLYSYITTYDITNGQYMSLNNQIHLRVNWSPCSYKK